VKDVSEMRKFGYTIREAIERCAANPYPPGFSRILRKIVARLRMGVGLEEASRDVRSTMTRLTFYLLSEVEESGGGSPQLLDRISELLRIYIYSKTKARASIRLYQVMSISLPFIVAFVATLVWCISGMIAPIAQMGSSSLIAIATQKDLEAMIPWVMLLAMEGSVIMMFIANRAIDHHPYNTWNLAIIAALTVVAYLLIGPLASPLSKALGIQEMGIPGVVG